MAGDQLELSSEELARLVRFAYMTCRDATLAQDLVQEAVYQVLAKGSKNPIEHPQAYLKATIVNVYINWGRRKSSTETRLDPDSPLLGPGFEDDLVERLAMWDALAKLTKRQRVVLALRYYEGMSDLEIAALLEWREATVRSLASRGIRALGQQSHFRNLRSATYKPATSRGHHD